MAEGGNFHSSNSQGEANGSQKRKSDGVSQPRAKRNRYISIACNECKRRKIKCNGQDPCQRCGNLSLECLYTPNCCNSNFKDTEEFRQMNAHIRSLEQQVDSLFHSLNALRSELVPNIDPALRNHYEPRSYPTPQPQSVIDSPSQARSKPASKTTHFQGPTSSAFSFGVARSSLQNMGIAGAEIGMDEGVTTQDVTPSLSPRLSNMPLHPSKDPIWALNKEEAERLCRVYEEEMGIMYPILDIEVLSRHACMLYTFIDAASRNGFFQRTLHGPDSIEDEGTDLLKMVLAVALITEGSGKSELGTRLFENVSERLKAHLLGSVDIKGVVILITQAMYYFHTDDEGMAWRIIGLTARHCIEIGLHRAETYDTLFDSDTERNRAIKIFWSVYVLDRRWSFGTGMPFALQDADIDPNLPRPDDSTPYLNVMIDYSHIGSKVWSSVASKPAINNQSPLMSPKRQEHIRYLDYQIIQWYKSIPDSLRYIHPSSTEYMIRNPSQNQEPDVHNESGGRAMYRLRVLLYLRLNQMRILIYRPALHSATSIQSPENIQFAQTVVDVAKDTIRVLKHVNETSDVYRAQQVCFHYFLLSALAVLFLAVSHAPVQFSAHARDEFYSALDLVRGLTADSYVSKRLWKTIRGLREVGPKLGLYASSSSTTAANTSTTANGTVLNSISLPAATASSPAADAHSSAAMAMAGLAGHPVDEALFFNSSSTATTAAPRASVGATPSGTSPGGMANELFNLFEAAGGYGNPLLAPQHQAQLQLQQQQQQQGAEIDGLDGVIGDGDGDGNGTVDGGVAWGWGTGEELSRIMRELF